MRSSRVIKVLLHYPSFLFISSVSTLTYFSMQHAQRARADSYIPCRCYLTLTANSSHCFCAERLHSRYLWILVTFNFHTLFSKILLYSAAGIIIHWYLELFLTKQQIFKVGFLFQAYFSRRYSKFKMVFKEGLGINAVKRGRVCRQARDMLSAYNPWGRPGCGAPSNSNDLRKKKVPDLYGPVSLDFSKFPRCLHW